MGGYRNYCFTVMVIAEMASIKGGERVQRKAARKEMGPLQMETCRFTTINSR